ncbi:EAL domain-containing protein [Chromobacterium haemolyticum]|uniref:EAL domain-containing response regulator n=1 Tax=Chromobacterium haemolyticum TaxID=394935 RepID=UPI00307ED96E
MLIQPKILIVDDHPVERFALRQKLAQLGYGDVISACGGHEAASVLERQSCDVVICDINMPQGDGTDVLQALQKIQQSRPYLIWLSSHGTEVRHSMLRLACDAGLHDTVSLVKPVNARTLQAALERCQDRECLPKAAQTCEEIDDRTLEQEIIKALYLENGFSIVLQPQFNLENGRIVGAEALARWQHPEWGAVPPEMFISKIEQLGLGHWFFFLVVNKILPLQARWHAQGLAVPIAINASATTLASSALPDCLERLMTQHGLPLRLLKVELMESLDTNQRLQLGICLNRLRIKGFPVSIDDFGIGISNLKLLSELPFSEIKIDRYFVSTLHEGTAQYRILQTIIALSRDLELSIVVEGVETSQQASILQNLGAHVIQGYWFSPPVDSKAFQTLLHDNQHTQKDAQQAQPQH